MTVLFCWGGGWAIEAPSGWAGLGGPEYKQRCGWSLPKSGHSQVKAPTDLYWNLVAPLFTDVLVVSLRRFIQV